MRAMRKTLLITGILSVAALWPRIAAADPPGRVGRLSYIEGTVTARTGNQDQWNNAVLNVPVTTGDGFWTEDDGRTEIQVGGMEIRTDHDTELDINQLDDDSTMLEVPQGVINVHIAQMPTGGVSVMTPAGETKLSEPGIYRIDAGQPQGNEPGSTEVIAVLEGGAMFTRPHASINIDAGEQAVLNGNPPSAGVERLVTTDFDNWAESRNPRVAVSSRERRVPIQVTGYQDLDRYGSWESDPEYGEVWYPEDISANWAPYREGYWSYVEPWGWTWIDDEPWGFAPYHYGRWVHRHHRWGWYPGRYYEAPPVYAPALVAFIGGRNWGVSLSLGDSEPVGWVPLAPNEPFYPYYRVSDRYRVNINRTTVNKTVINNITINNNGTINTTGGTLTAARLANSDAITVVRANDFRRGARANRVAVKVAETAVASAPVATTQVATIQPTEEARGGRGAARANRVNREARPPDRSAWREQRRQSRLNRQEPVTGAATPATTAMPPAAATTTTGTATPATAPVSESQTASTPAPRTLKPAQRREQRQTERQERAEERGRPERRGPHDVLNRRGRHVPAEANTVAAPEAAKVTTPEPSAQAPATTEPAAAPEVRTERAVDREQAQPRPQTRERQRERLREPPIAGRAVERNQARTNEARGLAEPLIEPSAGNPRNPRAAHQAVRERKQAVSERESRRKGENVREKRKDKEDKPAEEQ